MEMEDVKIVQRENIPPHQDLFNVMCVDVVENQSVERAVLSVIQVNFHQKEEHVNNVRMEPIPLMQAPVSATNVLLALNPTLTLPAVILVNQVLTLLMARIVNNAHPVNTHPNMEQRNALNVHVVMKKIPLQPLVFNVLQETSLPLMELVNLALFILSLQTVELVLAVSVEREWK